MASMDKELEEELLDAGNKLVDPPSSVEELLSLLDQLESCLTRVEQSPTDCIQNALSPSMKALIADRLFKHSDVDVKVAVASCISEITRITAPEAPYEDDRMKEVFQLIVSSFENLDDMQSRSYAKRTAILETVAKVRSCVVMLDLECDALILEMFKHFLNAIREHHPENVFSFMETVMTLVLEESEDVSLELLSPLLASIKKDNEEVYPIAKNLGEKVLQSCAAKLKPYLIQAVNTLNISVDDYCTVLTSICQETTDAMEKNEVSITNEHVEVKNKSTKQLQEESVPVVKEDASEATSPQHANPDVNRSPKSVMSNGVTCVGEDNPLADSKPIKIKKKEDVNCSNHSKGLNSTDHEVVNDLNTKKVYGGQKPEQVIRRRGRKSSSSTKSGKPSKVSQAAAKEKEAEKTLDSESHSREVSSFAHEGQSVEAAAPSEKDKYFDAKNSPSKVCDDEDESEVASPSPSESLHDENVSKKLGQTKKKDDPEGAAEEDVSKVSEGASDSEAKPARQSKRKTLARKSDVKKTIVPDLEKKESDTNAKKHSAKKLDENKKGGGGSSSKKIVDKKKVGGGEVNSETVMEKDMVSSPKSGIKLTKDENSEETFKTNTKRKHRSGKENESDIKEYGENLEGLRVEVWWPKDRQYYKGIIDSFLPSRKKHKVLYDDGDEEILNLVKEKWKVIESEPDGEGEESVPASPEPSTDMPPKKKGKTSVEESKKRAKMDSFSRSGGVAASSRSKGISTKASLKSKDGNKSKDSKTTSKSEDEEGKKSKDINPKSASVKSIVAQKMSGKSKNTDAPKTSKSKDGISTPKPSAKSKQETSRSGKSNKPETPKTATSKGKPPKGGGNGTGKLKRKELENEDSDVSARELEGTKSKTSNSTKAKGGEVKSGMSKANGSGNLKSGLLKRKELENEDSDVSERELEDTKSKTSNSSKAKGGEAKSEKFDVNGTGKMKSGLPKRKELENEDSDISGRDLEDTKGKTSNSSKPRGAEVKSGKKRRKI